MQLEMVNVRLISRGTSAIVTAYSTYFSGGSVIFDIALGKTVITDVVASSGYNIATCDPFSTEIAAMCQMDICPFTAWADI